MQSKNILPRILFFVLVIHIPFLYGGCAIAPGQYLDHSNWEENPTEMEVAQGTVPLVPINAELFPMGLTSPALIASSATSKHVPGTSDHKREDNPRFITASFSAVESNPSVVNYRQKSIEDKIQNYEYRVGPQDILSFTVWEHPELTIPAGEFRSAEITGHRVDAQGTIFFPYVGKIMVAGLTLPDIREKLTRLLGEYIPNPQLDLRVAAFRSQRVFVTGEVVKPTTLPITDVPLTLVDAINACEGPTSEADLQHVRVTRHHGSVVTKELNVDVQAIVDSGEAQRDMVLVDGDVVHVPDRQNNKVFVMGEVKKETVQLMHKGHMTLADALGYSGGLDKGSVNASRVYVIRGAERNGQAPTPVVFHLDAEKPDALLLSTRFELQPLDIVYVSTAEVSRFYRVMSQILPTWGTVVSPATGLEVP